MEPLEVLLKEEAEVLAAFSPPSLNLSRVADLIEGELEEGILPIGEVVDYAPEIVQAMTTAELFPLTPYLRLMAARVRFKAVKGHQMLEEVMLESVERTVKKHEKAVSNLVSRVAKKYETMIPTEVVEAYMTDLAGRLRAGTFDNVGLPSFLMTARDYR